MKAGIPYLISILIFSVFAAALLGSASSDPVQAQVVDMTPTPNDNGQILYFVKENDTCLSIALRFLNGDVNYLRELNDLDEECALSTNQQLIIGIEEQEVPTEGPSPTPEPTVPTPTYFPGVGNICVFLFNDVNGNGMIETGEPPIANGAISIANTDGTISLTGTTLSSAETVCFEDLPEDDYNISVGPPEGYNATTVMNYPLTLNAGDNAILDFGAQISLSALDTTEEEAAAATGNTVTTGSERSPLIGIFGFILVLSGIGLAVYYRYMNR